jgi:hypothetical protein
MEPIKRSARWLPTRLKSPIIRPLLAQLAWQIII